MLDIRTIRSKSKGIRVNLYRKIDNIDKATQKSKPLYRQVGSFSLSKGINHELLASLQTDEILQLKNWLADVEFAEQFDVEADELTKFTFRMPQKIYDALICLYAEAEKQNLHFIPNKIILNALIQDAKKIERDINSKTDIPCHILEEIGIDVVSQHKTHQLINEKVDQDCKIIFKKLLELNLPFGRLCSQLEDAARAIGKHQKIPPPQVREWVGDIATRNPNKPIKRWCYAIALDVLNKNHVDVFSLINPQFVVGYWAIPRKILQPEEQTKREFLERFHLPDNEKKMALQVITDIYNT